MVVTASCCGDVFHWAGTESLVRIETGAKVQLPTGLESDRTALNIAVQQCSPSNQIELERICTEECKKLSKYRCAKPVASYPRRLDGLIAAKGSE